MNTKVSIILLSSRKEKQLVLDCLQSLQNTHYLKSLLEIVLVDNASEDDVVSVVKKEFSKVHIIENKKNIGFAAGNNVGIFYALQNGADYVMVLNNDTEVDPHWLSEMLPVFGLDKKIGCVSSKVYLFDEKEKINTDGNLIHFLGFAYCGNYKKVDTTSEEKPRHITYPSGAAMLVKKEVIEKLGAFEEKMFIYHDDVEFGWRMNMAGYKTYLAPQSKIYHKYSFSKPSNKKMFLMERNRFIVLLENYKWQTLLLISPALLVMEIGMLFYSATNGFFTSKILSYGYFFKPKNLSQLLKDRKRKQALRKVSDKKLVEQFVGVVEFEDLKHPLLQYVANPLFRLYWGIVRRLIVW